MIFSITARFCFSMSAPFRILSPHSKLWYHICSQMVKQWWTWSCGYKVTCSRSQRSDCSLLLFKRKSFFFCFSPPNASFFVTDHTTKLGMKDLLKDQQWWVERDSNLIPHLYRLNALTTTPCSLSVSLKITQINFSLAGLSFMLGLSAHLS